jgi:hypothetical protein
MGYTKELLEAIAKKLHEMPPIEERKKEYSKQEAVRILAKEIIALKGRGYTIDQIAETLRGEGLDISTPTLKNYLQRAQQPKSAAKQSRRTRKDTPPPAAGPSVKEQATSKAKATFTPTPDSDDI